MNRSDKIILQFERGCPFCGHEKLMTIIQDGVEILETCASCSQSWELVEPEGIRNTWSDTSFTGANTGTSSSAGRRSSPYSASFKFFDEQVRESLYGVMSDRIRAAMRSATHNATRSVYRKPKNKHDSIS